MNTWLRMGEVRLAEAGIVCGMLGEDGGGCEQQGEAVNTWLRMGEVGLAEAGIVCGMLGGGWGRM